MSRVHFDPPGAGAKRRWWWVLALTVALAIGLAWWVAGRSRPEPLPAVAAPAVPAAPVAPAVIESLPPMSLPSAAPAAVARVEAPASAAASAVRFEVCGRGRMTEEQIERQFLAEVAVARAPLIDGLLRGSEAERLLGLLMGAHAAAISAAQAETQPCAPEDRACAQAAWQRQLAAAAPMAEAAVQLALASRDPALYGAAFVHACRGNDVDPRALPPSCARLSAAEWLQRDPGDATAALWTAHAARAKGDVAATDAALAAALRAQRWSWPSGQLVATLQASAGFQAVPAVHRLDLMAEVHGLSGAGGFLSLSPVLRQHACTPQALADPPRRDRCEDLVGRALAESPSLLDVAIAARMAGSLGWPAERVRAAEDQKLALQQALLPANRLEDLYTCDGIARQLRQSAAWGTLGETMAARRIIEASGRPLSAWAGEARAEAAARDAAFAGGARAAQPASAPRVNASKP